MKKFVLVLFLVPSILATCQENTSVPRAPRLRVLQSDTDAEKKALAEPFYGVSNNGAIASGLYSIEPTGISTKEIRVAMVNFLNSLSADQREASTFDINASEWRRWSNIDFYKRKGIGLPDLDEDQKSLAFRILEASLSPRGLEKAKDIMKMEDYLAYLAQDFEKLGGELYWFTFMGDPKGVGPCGWQLDGHHLVINYFMLGDQVVMTPTFMGSEPTFISEGEHEGTRTFENEEALGSSLYNSFSKEQKKSATLLDRKEFNYNQAESYMDNALIPFAGIRTDELTSAQKGLLKNLIQEYVGNIREGHADIRMKEVMEHFEETYFAWIGKSEADHPFYYRIQSPVILIEFDHQKPVFLEGDKPTRKHIHTVVRTPNGNDYGKDLLRQHLENHRHDSGHHHH